MAGTSHSIRAKPQMRAIIVSNLARSIGRIWMVSTSWTLTIMRTKKKVLRGKKRPSTNLILPKIECLVRPFMSKKAPQVLSIRRGLEELKWKNFKPSERLLLLGSKRGRKKNPRVLRRAVSGHSRLVRSSASLSKLEN
jgi:hypothetical protein